MGTIEKLRRVLELGVSQRTVAKSAGISQTAVSDLAAGKHGLRVVTQEKLEPVLDGFLSEHGVSPDGLGGVKQAKEEVSTKS